MKKLKDFFYDKNDIIIVLLILAVAAFIIYTRIETIIDYPEKLAKQAAATETTEITTETSTSSAVTVTIKSSDTVSTVSEKLASADLIDSVEGFKKYINGQKEKITFKAGTFQIPKNSSHEEILNIITN